MITLGEDAVCQTSFRCVVKIIVVQNFQFCTRKKIIPSNSLQFFGQFDHKTVLRKISGEKTISIPTLVFCGKSLQPFFITYKDDSFHQLYVELGLWLSRLRRRICMLGGCHVKRSTFLVLQQASFNLISASPTYKSSAFCHPQLPPATRWLYHNNDTYERKGTRKRKNCFDGRGSE